MAASDVRAGRAFVEFTTRDGELTKGLARARRKLNDFANSAAEVGAGLTAAGAALIAPLAAATRAFTSQADQVQKAAIRTGLSAEAYSELAYAAEQSGASAESLERGVRFAQRTITDAGDGTKEAVDALDRLGLSYERLRDLSPEDQFTLIADRISKVDNPTTRAAAAMELLGRGGADLLPLMEQGAQGIDLLRNRARELGLTIDRTSADLGVELGDLIDDLFKTIKRGGFEIGRTLAPELKDITERLIGVVVQTTKWAAENGRTIIGLGKLAIGATATGTALLGLSLAARGVSAALALINANPAVLALVGVGALVAGVTAELNNGKLAGVEYSEQFRQAAVAVGLLSDSADQLADANKRAEEAGKAAIRAMEDRQAAKSTLERVRATEAEIKTLEEMAKARKKVLLDEFVARGGSLDTTVGQQLAIGIQAEASQTDPVFKSLVQQMQDMRASMREGITQGIAEAVDQAAHATNRLNALAGAAAAERVRERTRLIDSLQQELELQQRLSIVTKTPSRPGVDNTARINELRRQVAGLGLAQIPDQLRAGFDEALKRGRLAAAEVEKFFQRLADFDQAVSRFATGGAGTIGERLARERRELEKQAETLKALTPERRREIGEAAGQRIVEERRRLTVQIETFGGSALSAEIDRITQEAKRLKEDIESLGALTPEITIQIDSAVNRQVEQIKRDLRAEIDVFTRTDVNADEVARIEAERDRLKAAARALGGDSASVEAKIDDAANEQIAEARARGEKELQDEIKRLTIQATKRGLNQRLALIELERKAAIENAKKLGQSIESINKRFDLERTIALQEAGEGPRGITNIRALQSLEVGQGAASDYEKRTAAAAEKQVQLSREIRQLIADGRVSIF